MKNTLFVLITMLFFSSISAQNGEPVINPPEINAAFVVGGNISNSEFLFRSGFNADVSFTTEIEAGYDLGGGLGIISLNSEIFVPIFAVFKGDISDDVPGWYYSAKLGYPYAHSKNFNAFADYRFIGLAYFEPTIGYQIPISDEAKFNAGFKLIGTLAKLSYTDSPNMIEYGELLPFVLLGFSFGVQF